MTEELKERIKAIIIAGGVFVPLLDYIHHILLAHPGGIDILNLPHNQQFILLALILVPLLVLRIVFVPALRRSNRDS
jgi:hypothetical protein